MKVLKKMEFTSEIISETSFSVQKLGNYSSEMELCSDLNKNDELTLYIIWSIPVLEEEICIGLEYYLNEDLKIVITGYDGVFSIPSEGIKLLESMGFNCEEII